MNNSIPHLEELRRRMGMNLKLRPPSERAKFIREIEKVGQRIELLKLMEATYRWRTM